jgi:hypothetical protein
MRSWRVRSLYRVEGGADDGESTQLACDALEFADAATATVAHRSTPRAKVVGAYRATTVGG